MSAQSAARATTGTPARARRHRLNQPTLAMRVLLYAGMIVALVVILAILAGAEIGGLVGVFLSIPALGLLMVFYNHYLAYRGIQNLRVVVPSEEAEGPPEIQLSAMPLEK